MHKTNESKLFQIRMFGLTGDESGFRLWNKCDSLETFLCSSRNKGAQNRFWFNEGVESKSESLDEIEINIRYFVSK
jgi:hypothetical protein